MAKSFKVTDANKRAQMAKVWHIVSNGVLSAPVMVYLDREKQARAQQERYHAMINDIAKQMEREGYNHDPIVWKGALIHLYEKDLKSQGKGLRRPGKCYISIDGEDVIQIRPSTKDLSKSEASDFIEFLFCFGAENKIVWSDPETRSMMEGAR